MNRRLLNLMPTGVGKSGFSTQMSENETVRAPLYAFLRDMKSELKAEQIAMKNEWKADQAAMKNELKADQVAAEARLTEMIKNNKDELKTMFEVDNNKVAMRAAVFTVALGSAAASVLTLIHFASINCK